VPTLTPSFQVLGYYWLILLPLLVMCVYFSIRGRGASAHILTGFIQLGIPIAVYATLLPHIPELFRFEYGFYMTILCSFVLIIGGVAEWGEG
jgi:cyanate permease